MIVVIQLAVCVLVTDLEIPVTFTAMAYPDMPPPGWGIFTGLHDFILE
jgi:hypothetical protein